MTIMTRMFSRTSKWRGILLLLLPAVALQAAIGIYPLIYIIWMAFHRYKLTRPGNYPFVGLDNFSTAISSGAFVQSLIPTLLFSAISVAGILILGLSTASLLNRSFRGVGFLKTATIIPWAIPYVAVGLIWATVFNGQWGLLNKLLYSLGVLDVQDYIPWMVSKGTAMAGICVAQIWKEMPFAVIFFLAGLQTIPTSLLEAARIDGAASRHILIHITLPLLRPILAMVGIYECFQAFTMFDIVYVMTGGGPAGSTELLAHLSYRTSFSYLDFGRGAALALLLTAILLISATLLLQGIGFRKAGEE